MLLDPVPVFHAFSATDSARVLRVEERITALSRLTTVEWRISRRKRTTDPPLGRDRESIYSLSARVVHGSNVEFLMPKMMSNQLVMECPNCVVGILKRSAVKPRPIHKVCSAIATAAADYFLLTAFLGLTKAVQPVFTIGTSTRNPERFFLPFCHLKLLRQAPASTIQGQSDSEPHSLCDREGFL